MVLRVGHRKHSGASSRRSTSSQEDMSDHEVAPDNDETVVDSEQGNVLMHIISQLRPGADLSRVTLPTFILEPRSMLERITNFMAHPETLLPMTTIEDPIERFVSVVKFYLSGWHIRPPGVKKPLNPVLGETFTGYWDYPDGTRGYYISEQTSHHPPKSSYFFMAPEHNIRIDGTLKPRSKFLGNSAASMMEGIGVMRFLNTGEKFYITQPNMYARGILFGKMKYELGDHSFVRCPESGLVADLDFKTKGYFSGTYDAIGGTIKDTKTDRILFELSGLWNGEMHIKDVTTNKKTLLFDATNAKHTPPKARPLTEQEPRESQRLWHKTIQALINRDHETATEEKTHIEDEQRSEAAKRTDDGVDWHPRLFRPVKGGKGGSEEGMEDLDWIINAQIDGKTPEEQTHQILQIAAILPGQINPSRFRIPSRSSSIDATTSHPSPRQSTHVTPRTSISEKPEADLIDFNQHEDDDRKPEPAAGETRRETAGMPMGLQEPLIPQSAASGEKQGEKVDEGDKKLV
ncbi:Oxysterol-binding protein [Eremomyces bilateralis CBS 781.70]|uniref:Oxysterol-binding protein n=1 Tax=Eremomyces bilateralis CBS 781.70 TaxID=1392243 RepID=A0A6G1GE88_9PEZI|nr:Oxysterol-binding protein [Eremomyces bilateralis CBS 781.70]KAF1816179.1 Oxysterol-binding protein [Eremomyces bilateralis CBS 781.70]